MHVKYKRNKKYSIQSILIENKTLNLSVMSKIFAYWNNISNTG